MSIPLIKPICKIDFVLVIQRKEDSRAVVAHANDMGHEALMASLRLNDIFKSEIRQRFFQGVLYQSASMCVMDSACCRQWRN